MPQSLDELAAALERDRREPDKVLLYVHDLHRMARELRDVAEWAAKDEGRAHLRLIQARDLLDRIAGYDG